jgi:hypothetical protein
MMMQQWILARPEISQFLGRRPMVAYDEDWMAAADAMKTLMGWSDTSVTHFRDLARFGEKILVSIRMNHWPGETDPVVARDWANIFRPQIQGYVHAYRVVTGIDLTLEPKDERDTARRAELPSLILERRLIEQRRSLPTAR